jgi:hypothetical protein
MAQSFHLTNGSSWNICKVEETCHLSHPNRLMIRSEILQLGSTSSQHQ